MKRAGQVGDRGPGALGRFRGARWKPAVEVCSTDSDPQPGSASIASFRLARSASKGSMWKLFAVLALAAPTACSTAQSYDPVVDLEGVDYAQYHADLADCRRYAERVDPAHEATTSALTGAVIGTALGAAIGAATGNAGFGAGVGAASGGGAGLLYGGSQAVADQEDIVRNCLQGRGYRVLR